MALVLFMRGVNVGGAKRFQPSLLARELEHLGVSNLGAAGTFVIRARVGQAALRAEFLRRLPFTCELMVCKGRDVLSLLVGLSGRFILCHWRRLGTSSLEPNTLIEKQFGVSATTRNWNTILRVCQLLKP